MQFQGAVAQHLRCIGSAQAGFQLLQGKLLDGLTTGMRGIAVATCKLFNRPLNPFLQDKLGERTITSYQRIFTSYRLIGEFLPGSPLASISDKVWDELHYAIEIRNRIVHPKEPRDMMLREDQTLMVMRTGKEFHEHFGKFYVWFMEKQQKLVMSHVVTYRRLVPKTGRNEPCPCGSKQSYKDCCFKATMVAAQLSTAISLNQHGRRAGRHRCKISLPFLDPQRWTVGMGRVRFERAAAALRYARAQRRAAR